MSLLFLGGGFILIYKLITIMMQLEFATLLHNNKAAIYKVIKQNIRDHSWHDDIFQDISMKAWKSYESFRNECTFTTWVCQIAKYTIIDKIRYIKSEANRISKYNIFYEITSSMIDEPYEEQDIPVIDTLSSVELRTMEMRIDGLSFREISEITGEPEARLRTRMHRLKEKLAESIKNKKTR